MGWKVGSLIGATLQRKGIYTNRKQPLCVCCWTEIATAYLTGQDNPRLQFYNKCSLISAPNSIIYPIVDCHEFSRSQECQNDPSKL